MQRRTHSHLPVKSTYSPEQAARNGVDAAAHILQPLYKHDDITSGTYSPSELLAAMARAAHEQGSTPEATSLRCLAESADYVIAYKQRQVSRGHMMLAERYGEEPQESLVAAYYEAREALLSGNEAIKEYLAVHPSEPIETLHSMMWTAATINAKEEYGFDLNAMEVDEIGLLQNIRGMRGELSFEQILNKFEDVTIHDAPADPEARRTADKRGIDYVIDVYVQPINELFTLELDIKNNPQFTMDEETGKPIPGKIWNQCANGDYLDNSATLAPGTVMRKAIPMQRAVIQQIQLIHEAKLAAACKKTGVADVSELYFD